MKLKKIITSKKGLVIEYALFAGLLLFSFSMIIFTSWSRTQLRDKYYDSHISKPVEFERAGQEFFKICQQYCQLSPEEQATSTIVDDFRYPFVNYDCNASVTRISDIYTYDVSICTNEEENTWVLTLEVKVSITEEKIVKWYFVNPLLESELYTNLVKGGDE